MPIDAREIRFDALVAASGKCLEGVPGMGFIFMRTAALADCAGRSHSLAMDLHDQHAYMERTGQWRFTPPTHVVAALAEALRQYEEEGGQPARLARYVANCKPPSSSGLAASSASCPFLEPAIQAPIIVTVHAPADPAYAFKPFYDAVKARGFVLYPGKLTEARDLSSRLHRRDRPERDEAGRGRHRRSDEARSASPPAHPTCVERRAAPSASQTENAADDHTHPRAPGPDRRPQER